MARARRWRLIAGLAGLAVTGRAMTGSPPVVNPADYPSASGQYVLHVDPFDLYGRGPADYQMTKAGAVAWSNQLPFSLRHTVVSRDGAVAGLARTSGWSGRDRYPRTDCGDWAVVVLAPSGSVVALHKEPRAVGLFELPSRGEVIVRLADADGQGREHWRFYDLHSGAPGRTVGVQDAPPGSNVRPFILDARALPDLPLVLVHWWMHGMKPGGVRYSLLDVEGREQWLLELDGAYGLPGGESISEGAILDVQPGGRFAVHAVKAGERIHFAAVQNPQGGWSVREVERHPHVPAPIPATTNAVVWKATLVPLGITKLSGGTGVATSLLANIASFTFDGTGRICAQARSGAENLLLLLTPKGVVLKQVTLPFHPPFSNTNWNVVGPAWVGGQGFVVAMSIGRPAETSFVYRVDFAAGTVSALTTGDVPSITALAGFPDGRFAAITDRSMEHTSYAGLVFFTANGGISWRREDRNGYAGADDELLSPEDLMAVGDHAVAVLDTIRHTIQTFAWSGQLMRSVDLDQVWDHKPNYPTHLSADGDEGFLLYDFHAPQPLVRLHPDGRIRSAGVPRYADGLRINVRGRVMRAPDGALWVGDGRTALRLNRELMGEWAMSGPVDEQALSEPGCVRVFDDGRIAIADEHTRVTHVFGPDGRALVRCQPGRRDYDEIAAVNDLALDGRDRLFAGFFSDEQFRQAYGSDGRCEKDFGNRWDRITEKWLFQPGTRRCWVVGYEQLFLVDEEKTFVRTLARRADGRWLANLHSTAVAQDGSLALVSTERSGRPALNIFAPDGQPRLLRKMDDVPAFPLGQIAFDGRRVFARDKESVWIVDAAGGPPGQARIPEEMCVPDFHGPFSVKGGKELWFVDTRHLAVHRFAAPDA